MLLSIGSTPSIGPSVSRRPCFNFLPKELEGCRDPALLNDWHVVGVSEDVVQGQLVPVTLLDRDPVMWRDSDGTLHVWEDNGLTRVQLDRHTAKAWQLPVHLPNESGQR
ncbi:hypothetical protein [Paraburkholderia rhizosphaerae]|uniref:Rieske domain-containing protein n=1 Tax=Paraburkholderia rhizosphaerae TaxID=480658 RepID=A0A4R8LIS6_9BURK|nr:hypothetical protein [Paraburkholderia rhizosphaerae]TDY43343.1 hypothetical protein BX592_118138 [Paraburkholderia rhizosphaerae]